MPDQDLIEIIEEHLKHEIDMLRRTYTQLSKVDSNDETDEQRTIRNALIESFCVHARSLLYFFANKALMATDAIAKKFTDGFNRIGFSDKSVKDLLEKLNKQIFHLTKKRTTVESGKFNVGKDGMEALQIIEPAIESFTRCLSPNFQPHFKCTTTPLLVRNLLPFASTTATFAGTAKQARV